MGQSNSRDKVFYIQQKLRQLPGQDVAEQEITALNSNAV
jgi:hypothetical protein